MPTAALSWSLAEERARRALHLGKLIRIPTRVEPVLDGGIPFVVRILAEPSRDAKTPPSGHDRGDDWVNPFLPYDDDLFLAPVTATHVCLLNKYVVLPHHLLLVTREFESQDTWLTGNDCEAMWTALRAWDGLVFYNAGRIAGASQPHKHLQLVRPPLAPGEPRFPIEAALAGIERRSAIHALPGLPFAHAVARVDPAWLEDPVAGAAGTLALLAAMRRALRLDERFTPYNLLATRAWIMLVPRSREKSDGISVNAIGFAGGLLVRDEAALQYLKALGPLMLLRHVGLPAVSLEGSG